MGFDLTTRDAIECIKNLKKIQHDGMQFDACLSKAISDLEEFEECKKRYEGGRPMTPNEYQKLAARTINPKLTPAGQERHALYGMCGEIGELQSLYQKEYQGHKFDGLHAKKELGDLLWFVAEYCTAMGWSLEDVMTANIKKLQERYPDGFDNWHSLHRKEGDI